MLVITPLELPLRKRSRGLLAAQADQHVDIVDIHSGRDKARRVARTGCLDESLVFRQSGMRIGEARV